MQRALIVFFALVCSVGAASAQTAVTLNAEPVPIIEVQINGAPVRLEVDTNAGAYVMMERAVAERLRLRPMLLQRFRVGVDGSDQMLNGRVARSTLRFANGAETELSVGIFGVPVSSRADGVIGPGALPYDVVTITLSEPQPGETDIVLPLGDPSSWRGRAQVAGEDYVIGMHLERPQTVINRRASRSLDATGLLEESGELVETRAILGLTTAMQPVRTSIKLDGLPLGETLARINSPLLGAVEPDALVVTAPQEESSVPALFLGRQALSRCSSLRADRQASTLTLRCTH